LLIVLFGSIFIINILKNTKRGCNQLQMKNSKPIIKNTEENKKRRKAKLARGIGILAMEKAGSDHKQWTIARDPLYQVKGMKRHKLIMNISGCIS
jgi:hypothetical protein